MTWSTGGENLYLLRYLRTIIWELPFRWLSFRWPHTLAYTWTSLDFQQANRWFLGIVYKHVSDIFSPIQDITGTWCVCARVLLISNIPFGMASVRVERLVIWGVGESLHLCAKDLCGSGCCRRDWTYGDWSISHFGIGSLPMITVAHIFLEQTPTSKWCCEHPAQRCFPFVNCQYKWRYLHWILVVRCWVRR